MLDWLFTNVAWDFLLYLLVLLGSSILSFHVRRIEARLESEKQPQVVEDLQRGEVGGLGEGVVPIKKEEKEKGGESKKIGDVFPENSSVLRKRRKPKTRKVNSIRSKISRKFEKNLKVKGEQVNQVKKLKNTKIRNVRKSTMKLRKIKSN